MDLRTYKRKPELVHAIYFEKAGSYEIDGAVIAILYDDTYAIIMGEPLPDPDEPRVQLVNAAQMRGSEFRNQYDPV